jgi:protein tyrosine/serine phosphatase
MTSTAPPRWIALEGAANVRDVGGLPTRDGRATRSGVLLRADNLQTLLPHDVELLVEGLGLRTVIDLRTAGEVRSEGPGPLVAAGLRHVHLSLVPELGRATDVDVDRLLPPSGRRDRAAAWAGGPVKVYLGYLADSPDAAVAAVRTVADPNSGTSVVHCAAGKDRTGVVIGLILDAVGVTREAVVADYAASAEVVEAVIARLRSSPTYAEDLRDTSPARHTPHPETMADLLAELDAGWGGAAGWLTAHGLTPEELAGLADRLVG